MRKYRAGILGAVLAILLTLGLATIAMALPNFTQGVGTVPACQTCHSGAFPSGVHAVTAHQGFINTCTTCHTVNTATPPLPTACAANNCHGGVTAIIASTTHVANGCNTTPGCHGVPAVTFTITASAGAGGTINPSGGVTVTQGTSKTFTITANAGFHVADVLVDGTSVGARTTYTFTNVIANHTIAASFAANPPNVIVYTDVKPSDYFYAAVTALTQDGIVTGYKNANGTFSFRPYNAVARAQFAKMIVGGLGLHTASIETTSPTFADVTTIASYPFDYVEEASAAGIVFGYKLANGDMVFRPYNLITRVQIAQMIVRGAAAAGITLASPGPTDTFTDIGGLSASAQLAIRTCAANGIVTGYANANGSFSFKPYNNATRGQAAVMLYRLMLKM